MTPIDMSNRCLIIGASGQLGRALAAALRPRYDVIEAARRPQPGQLALDLTDPDGMLEALRSARPAWILLAGAYCNVDLAETERERCALVNAVGPRLVAEYAKSRRCAVVHFSTDHVFDGSQPIYRETDAVSPLNWYARTKADGEAAVRELLPERHLILRTASLYGPDPARRNFVLRLVDRLAAGEQVIVPSDQVGSPTYTEDLASAARALMEHAYGGTFHAVGPDWVDRVAFARRACEIFGFGPDRILPAATPDLCQPGRRPLRVRLDCAALRAAGVGEFRGIEEGLRGLRVFLDAPTGAVA